ncbi:MAG: hypothetical protein V1787_03110 [Candidatus Micrarchaeota archaeon]
MARLLLASSAEHEGASGLAERIKREAGRGPGRENRLDALFRATLEPEKIAPHMEELRTQSRRLLLMFRTALFGAGYESPSSPSPRHPREVRSSPAEAPMRRDRPPAGRRPDEEMQSRSWRPPGQLESHAQRVRDKFSPRSIPVRAPKASSPAEPPKEGPPNSVRGFTSPRPGFMLESAEQGHVFRLLDAVHRKHVAKLGVDELSRILGPPRHAYAPAYREFTAALREARSRGIPLKDVETEVRRIIVLQADEVRQTRTDELKKMRALVVTNAMLDAVRSMQRR